MASRETRNSLLILSCEYAAVDGIMRVPCEFRLQILRKPSAAGEVREIERVSKRELHESCASFYGEAFLLSVPFTHEGRCRAQHSDRSWLLEVVSALDM